MGSYCATAVLCLIIFWNDRKIGYFVTAIALACLAVAALLARLSLAVAAAAGLSLAGLALAVLASRANGKSRKWE